MAIPCPLSEINKTVKSEGHNGKIKSKHIHTHTHTHIHTHSHMYASGHILQKVSLHSTFEHRYFQPLHLIW